MTKLFCDICGIENSTLHHYTAPGYTQAKAVAHGVTVMVFEQPVDVEIEICADCQEKIRKILRIVK